jgi:protein-S-isoprenylcysteine O-methyltransferase Ste14
VFASGLLTLLNLAVLAWVVDRVVRATASGEGGGAAIGVITGKTIIVLMAYGALLSVFPAPSVALGLGAGLLGLVIRGTVDAWRAKGDVVAEES